MKQDNLFLRKEYRRNLFPIMFSVLGGTINALIDSVFVSQALGTDSLAAVNVSMPIYLLLCTVGSWIANGTSTLSAQNAGKGDMERAESYYKEALFLCILSGAVIMVSGIALCRPISALLAQNGNLSQYVYEYCLVTLIGSPIIMALYLPTNYLQLDGKTHHISIMFAIVIVADLILDFLLIVVFPFGIYGAASASVISIGIACIYGFVSLERGSTNFHFGLKLPENLGNIMKFGSPAALGNLSDTIKLLILNALILRFYGGETSAVWAAVNTLCELSLIIISGIPRAAYPMLCAYFTSRENNGIRILIKLEIYTGIVLSAIAAIGLTVMNIPIAKIFGLSSSMLIPCICVGGSTIFFVIGSIWDSYLNAIGANLASNLISGARKLFLPVLTAFMIATLNGCIWLFLPLSGILTIVFGLFVTWFPYRKQLKTERYVSRLLLLDDYLERENKILDFSIHADIESVCNASEQIQEFCGENNMNMKQTMKLGLAIEELLNVIIAKSSGIDSVDLRAFAIDSSAGLRIRCSGANYDPFHDSDSDDEFLMGIEMIRKMADVTEHTYSLGMNVITIIFPLESEK